MSLFYLQYMLAINTCSRVDVPKRRVLKCSRPFCIVVYTLCSCGLGSYHKSPPNTVPIQCLPSAKYSPNDQSVLALPILLRMLWELTFVSQRAFCIKRAPMAEDISQTHCQSCIILQLLLCQQIMFGDSSEKLNIEIRYVLV